MGLSEAVSRVGLPVHPQQEPDHREGGQLGGVNALASTWQSGVDFCASDNPPSLVTCEKQKPWGGGNEGMRAWLEHEEVIHLS